MDSLRVFDGDTVHDQPLTGELCGRLHQIPDVTTTANNVTFLFKTDDSGRMMGFGIYYTLYTDRTLEIYSRMVIFQNKRIWAN